MPLRPGVPERVPEDQSWQHRRFASQNELRTSRWVGTMTLVSSTHLSLHYHLIFGTKGRVPWIDIAWRDRLHAYIGGVLRDLDVAPEACGGVADHIHILAGLRATHRLSDVMRNLKRSSSEWVHVSIGMKEFAWQEGYGAFTVSESSREEVRTYIAKQEEHHRRRTFREEYVEFLRRHQVAFDERFLD